MTEITSVPNERPTLRKILAIAASIIAILVALPAGFYFLHDWSNKPLCNKQTLFEVMNWFDNKKPSALPNVNGNSSESLIQLKQDGYDSKEEFKKAIDEWDEKYQYIPGLRKGDPGDLILMYMKKPTRWLHHAATPRLVFHEAKWCIVSLDFGDSWPGWSVRVQRVMPEQSECAENVSSAEFVSRLRKTLDYLQKNNRPNWQTVVAENEELLKTLERK